MFSEDTDAALGDLCLPSEGIERIAAQAPY
jgi:hypothetical protein